MAGVSGPCPSCGAPITAPSIEDESAERERSAFKVEPRHSRPRPAGTPEVVSRPMPEYDPHSSYSASSKAPPRPKDPKRLFRLIISVLVLAAMVGVSYALHAYLLAGTRKGPSSDVSTVRKIIPDDDPAPEIPVAASVAPITPPPAAPEAQPGVVASKVLEQFLNAKTLAERLPLIETKQTEAALASSVLARPLPAFTQILPELQETNTAGHFIDSFFSVDFATAAGLSRYAILVRVPETGDPKVVVDPFLDTFGGRLADFASAPNDKPQSFQLIVAAVAKCYDKSVPNREQKLGLKLMASDNQKEIAIAYFNKLSKIGEMLQDDSYGFRYGQARSARVTLQWNTQENPGMPFLEAVTLTEFRWNP